MPVKLMAEELRYYARSERHARLFQDWLARATPAYPLREASAVAVAADASAVPAKLFPLLETDKLGGLVLFSEQLPSTQTLLHETLRPAPPAGVVCFTELQVQGKGRGANTWAAPAGCLTFSFSSKFTDGSTLPFAQYLVSLAVVRAVEKVRPGADAVRIKWPNDIYARGVKIGGILCQSDYRDGAFHLTTGIGLNISNKSPTTCLQDVLGTVDDPCNVTKEEVLAAFLNAYEPMEALFLEKGFDPFMSDYVQRWLHTDQVVEVSDSAAGEGTGKKTSAVIKGLTSTGCLLAEGVDDGSRLELYPDGNSFDFLSGLLKRKL